MSKSVALYFGSFNPIHRGHIAVAEWVLARGVADEVWFVVSPRNPLKSPAELLDEGERLRMVEIAIAESAYPARMKACDVEFPMPRPSYTIDTLRRLGALYPATSFSLLVGGDIVGQFAAWKDWRVIAENYPILVYPREGYDTQGEHETKHAVDFTYLAGAPMQDYSSTEVREAIAAGAAEAMLPRGVYDYIKERQLWK